MRLKGINIGHEGLIFEKFSKTGQPKKFFVVKVT